MQTKTCSKCKLAKTINEFRKNRSKCDGLSSQCANCESKRDAINRKNITPEYATWTRVRVRCKPKYRDHHRYYDRGIRVCARWDSFDAFFADMGNKPSPTHQIDRINNDGNYEPTNCRWATPAENTRNTCRTIFSIPDVKSVRLLSDMGIKQSDLAEMFGSTASAIRMIQKNKNWKGINYEL